MYSYSYSTGTYTYIYAIAIYAPLRNPVMELVWQVAGIAGPCMKIVTEVAYISIIFITWILNFD
jgi:hypothetical protein